MATLTRSNSRVNPPIYKEYVNFLASYKNGKKEENVETGKNFSLSNSDSGISEKNFSLSNSSTSTSSSSLSSDVTDFSKKSKNSCSSYSSYLESSKTKKFSSVKPKTEQEKKIKKSEIFIEIEPVKTVSEVSKIFETQERKKSNKINSKISIFEKQISTENKPKLAVKPAVTRSVSSSPKIDVLSLKETKVVEAAPPPPKPLEEIVVTTVNNVNNSKVVPPPPPMPSATFSKPVVPPVASNGHVKPVVPPVTSNGHLPPPVPKIQASLIKGPQTKYTTNGTLPSEIDRNDPLVRKLVYGTLRGLYGAYHDKANDMLATLPKNMVVKSNGVQDRIEQIAANGDLDKLNGRVNPKLEQD